jgi:hypothetical protein
MLKHQKHTSTAQENRADLSSTLHIINAFNQYVVDASSSRARSKLSLDDMDENQINHSTLTPPKLSAYEPIISPKKPPQKKIKTTMRLNMQQKPHAFNMIGDDHKKTKTKPLHTSSAPNTSRFSKSAYSLYSPNGHQKRTTQIQPKSCTTSPKPAIAPTSPYAKIGGNIMR